MRLTGSGLGCPTWPKCYGNVYPPLNTHAVIEFTNRMLTFPVSLAAGGAWLAARCAGAPTAATWCGSARCCRSGVLGQAVLGGFTVKGALDYGWVMGHFALSMLILLAAVLLVWRATHEPDARSQYGEALGASTADAAPDSDRTLVLWLRGLVALGALTIFAGTAATAAGPHAGGSPGQKINRLSFDGRGTMDFVIHRHAEIALVFSLACASRPGGWPGATKRPRRCSGR